MISLALFCLGFVMAYVIAYAFLLEAPKSRLSWTEAERLKLEDDWHETHGR